MPRGKLTAGLSVGFMGLAASTLGVATFLPDDIDSSGRQRSPVGLLLGHEPAQSTAIVRIVLTVWLVSMTWVVIGVVRSRRPAPPVFPHPPPVSFPNPRGR